MARGNTTASGTQGEGLGNQGAATAEMDEEIMREQEMYWEETLEEVEAETSAHEMNVVNSVTPTLAPTPVRPPPIRPPINPSIPKKSYKKRNFKRPPPLQPSSLRPVAPQPCPLRPQSTTVRPQTMPPPPSFQPHPIVSMHTMHGVSAGTTSRFNQFMPTPGT
ncbi:hypothetical protein PIB30_044931 [Stylosanthes scabra]|uniref:Uncharacterized protein n=1 Tax=Stylosanthes scabra TaxID=79078 RepID=A0ABU6ZES0_9FABA|nr:hypothetical protein [Stylosanthes scabra]